MFTIPNLPTDSLYKFFLVSGLVLMIYSGYLRTVVNESSIIDDLKADSLNIVLTENINIRSRVLKLQNDQLDMYIKSFKGSIEERINLVKEKKQQSTQYKAISKNADEERLFVNQMTFKIRQFTDGDE